MFCQETVWFKTINDYVCLALKIQFATVVYLRSPLIITGLIARGAFTATATAGATLVFLLFLS